MSKTVQDGSKATYNGKNIFVNPACYNVCDLQKNSSIDLNNIKTYDDNNTHSWIWMAIFIPIGVLLLLFISIMVYFHLK